MRIFIEKENYPLKLLKEVFQDRFFVPVNKEGILNYVGYHYNNGVITFILPKIFINDKGLIFNKYSKLEVCKRSIYDVVGNQDEIIWIKKFLITFYKSLIEYKARHKMSSIMDKEITVQLNNLYGNSDFSYLDLVLSFLNFHNQNKYLFTYIYKEKNSRKNKKIKWEKTIRKNTPTIIEGNQPIYFNKRERQKQLDDQEILFKIFYSTLHYFKKEFNLNISIESFYKIEKGVAYEKMCRQAPKILKKVRSKYFSDILIKLFKLLEIYFNQFNPVEIKSKKEEFLSVKDYHIVFEDMIDKIFSDNFADVNTSKNISLEKLKKQKDGKLVDHLFKYDSIIDTDEKIFYIGDSKYYKPTNSIGEHSIYKQFTYAKNIIQFNIDLLNEGKNDKLDSNIRYLDEVTEGYSISPNFFIQAIICNDFNFSDHCIEIDYTKGNNGVEESFHFKNRLFDRDTLFVHYYKINFLFVLETYTNTNRYILSKLRKNIKKSFRDNFINYINEFSGISFYIKEFRNNVSLNEFVEKNFKLLNGKMYKTKKSENKLIIARYADDDKITSFINDISLIKFT